MIETSKLNMHEIYDSLSASIFLWHAALLNQLIVCFYDPFYCVFLIVLHRFSYMKE